MSNFVPHAYRNLLFAVLALQNDFVARDELIEAMNAWVMAKHRPLGEILEQRGRLSPADRALLDALVNRQVDRPPLEAAVRTLQSLSETCSVLQGVQDAEIQAAVRTLRATLDGLPSTQGFIGRSADETGRYKMLRPHAAGGLGEVFVALDTELNREVALKRIKPSINVDAAQQSRFVLEAEVTGGLEHPGVVPVYSLGGDEAGRPFYVMRFIRGDSLRDAIERFHARAGSTAGPGATTGADFSSMEFRDLLGRLVDVCNAVAYAHCRGVLHRDLKPSNIMLGQFGETLIVDWGLAKRLKDDATFGGASSEVAPVSDDAGPSGERTAPGSALGTPAYMSPEQAEGRVRELGPATDVYSLGATLYSLLAGTAPFAGDSIFAVLESVRAGRLKPPSRVQPGVPKPLEAICLKAMALAPADRYDDAKLLASDLERWLADEPTTAFREGRAARARRWIRRHRGLASAGVAAAIVGLLGAAIGLWAVNDRNRELALSLERESRERAKAVANEQRAETEFRRAKKAIDDYFTAVGQSTELRRKFPGMHKFRLSLLEKAQSYYEEFLRHRKDDPALQADAASAFFNRAFVANEAGRLTDAESSYRSALAIRERLAASDNGPIAAAALASTHNNLANCCRMLGTVDDAIAHHTKALELRQALVSKHPADDEHMIAMATSQHNLAEMLRIKGRPEDALVAYRSALATRERLARRQPQDVDLAAAVARSHNNIGLLLDSMNRSDDAIASLSAAVATLEGIHRRQPESTDHQAALARTANNLGELQRVAGRAKDAEASYQSALRHLNALVERNPGVIEFSSDLAAAHNNLANLCRVADRPDEAIANYRAALALHDAMARQNPNGVELAADRAALLENTSNLLRALGRSREAMVDAEKLATLRAILWKAAPARPERAVALAAAHTGLGLLQRDLARSTDAKESYRAAIALYEKCVAGDPSNLDIVVDLGGALCNLGNLLSDAFSPKDAIEPYSRAIRLLETHAREIPLARDYLRNSLWGRGQSYVKSDQLDKAIVDFDAALKLGDGAVGEHIRTARRIAIEKRAALEAKSRKSPQ